MARRDMGKLVFLDLVDRSGKIQLLVAEDRVGPVDVDLGDIVGVTGMPAKTKRGEPSLAVDELELLAKIRRPLPDTFHGVTDTETRYRQRYLDLLMNEETRARLRGARAHGRGDPPLPRRRRLRRGRDADPPAALRRRASPSRSSPTRTSSTRTSISASRPSSTSSGSSSAASSACTSSARTSATRASRTSTSPSSRCSSGTRPTRTTGHDGADRGARRDRRARDARHDEGHVPRARGRPRGAVEARQASSRRSRSAGSGRATRTSSAALLDERGVDTGANETWASSSTTRSATSSSPTWSSRRSSTTTRSSSRRSRARRTTTRRSSSGSSTSSAGWSSGTRSPRSTTPTSRPSGSRSRRRTPAGRAGRPGLRRGARLRDAADGRARARHRPAGDGAHRQGDIRDVILFPALRERD